MVISILDRDSACGREWDGFCVVYYNDCYNKACGADRQALVDQYALTGGPLGGPIDRAFINSKCPSTPQPTPRPTPATPRPSRTPYCDYCFTPGIELTPECAAADPAIREIIAQDSGCGRRWDAYCIVEYNDCYNDACGAENQGLIDNIAETGGPYGRPIDRAQILRNCPITARPTPLPTPRPSSTPGGKGSKVGKKGSKGGKGGKKGGKKGGDYYYVPNAEVVIEIIEVEVDRVVEVDFEEVTVTVSEVDAGDVVFIGNSNEQAVPNVAKDLP